MSNPLASVRQLTSREPNQINAAKNGSHLIQVTGVYLKLPQLVIIPAIAYLQRFYLTNSPADYPVYNMAHAALLTTIKLHEIQPDIASSSKISSVLQFISNRGTEIVSFNPDHELSPSTDYEMELLATLNFDTTLLLPHSFALSYIQLLKLYQFDKFSQTLWAYLNDAIRTTQIFIIHHPNVIAAACIMLTATELNITISPNSEWWNLFDVESEDLGHSMALIMDGIYNDKK